jgi:hypothetical protein
MSELKKLLRLYRKYGLVVIPLAQLSKVPIKGFDLEKVYDTGQVEYYWEKHQGNIGVVSGFNNLLIIDCDSPEAITWFESQEEYIPTTTVKTRRGHHYWYGLYNVPEEFEKRSIKLNDPDEVFKIEFLFGRRYAVAPPSEVRHNGSIHKYVFVEGYDVIKHELNIALLDFEAFKKLLVKAYKRSGKEYETERVQANVQVFAPKVGDETKVSKFLQIVELCKKYYTEGMRQTIWLGLSGIARKLHLPKEVVEDILRKELYEEQNDDDSIKQRLSAIEETYKKPIEEIAGISILTQQVFNEEDARTALYILGRFGKPKVPGVPVFTEDDLGRAQEIIKHGTKLFALIENDWYLLTENEKSEKDEKKIKKLKPVCAGFLLKDRGFKLSTNEPVYIVYNCEARRTGRITLDINRLQNFLGRPILDTHNVKFLLDALIRNHQEKLFVSEIGWFKIGSKRVFIHPLNQSALLEQGLYCDLDPKDVEHFKYINASKQHEVVRELLIEGLWLGVKIVLGVASLFIDENTAGFTIFDIGPRGVGKTTTSQFIMSLFYNINVPITLNATETGFELYMRKFHNLPILFDETALISDSKLQERIFKIAGGMGKLRGTKDLSIDITLLKSVVFVTGEVDPQFERRGAERRYVIVPVDHWGNYTMKYDPQTLHQIMRLTCGAGFDYIKFLEQEGDVEIEVSMPEHFQIFTFTKLIEKSFNFLKKFYNLSRQEISVLERNLYALLSYQLEKLDLSLEKVLADFAEFLLSRAPHFIIRNSSVQQVPRNRIYGEIDPLAEKAYITRECLEDFRDFVKLDLRTILKLFEEAEIITVYYTTDSTGTVKRYTKAKRIKYMETDITASVYEFNLKKVSEELASDLAGAVMRGAGPPNPLAQTITMPKEEEPEEDLKEVNIPTPDDGIPF